jgi:hypothetical protein
VRLLASLELDVAQSGKIWIWSLQQKFEKKL